MLNTLFYFLSLPTGILASVFLLKTLTGTARGHSTMAEKTTTTLASLIVLGMLYGAFVLVRQGEQGLGISVVVFSWLVFIGIMLLSGLMNTKLWN